MLLTRIFAEYDDVFKWKHLPRFWPSVRRIHRSPVNSPLKGQWRGYLMFSLICDRTNCWANNQDAGDLRRIRAHYDVSVMFDSQLGVVIMSKHYVEISHSHMNCSSIVSMAQNQYICSLSSFIPGGTYELTIVHFGSGNALVVVGH